jgi:hypothetical protein
MQERKSLFFTRKSFGSLERIKSVPLTKAFWPKSMAITPKYHPKIVLCFLTKTHALTSLL